MTQTLAIFLDAYRDLNAKKLFWIVLGLSGLVVLVFLAIGMDNNGLSFLGMHFKDYPRTPLDDRQAFFVNGLFVKFGIDIWLSIIAAILALISTAGVFPELIASGSIDLYLSRPIGRLRLFFTRYIAAMSFVFLQVLVFTAGCFFVLGIRADVWKPGIFLAVPVVVVFYSYLYCVCVLVGLLTRSTIAALLLTLLFWAAAFGINFLEQASLMNLSLSEAAIERLTPKVTERQAKLLTFDAEGGEATQLQRRAPLVASLEDAKGNLASAHQKRSSSWHPGIYAIKTILPKTSETVDLLQRWLKRVTNPEEDERIQKLTLGDPKSDAPVGGLLDITHPDFFKAARRTGEIIESRSVGWVAGTSLGFEAVVLALSAWIFCRRDY